MVVVGRFERHLPALKICIQPASALFALPPVLAVGNENQ